MDNMTTIYKCDSTKGSWNCILEELELPADTDEICVKHVSHITGKHRAAMKKTAENYEE